MNQGQHSLALSLQHITNHIMQNAVVLIVSQFCRSIDTTATLNDLLLSIGAGNRDWNRCRRMQRLQVTDIDPLFAGQL